MLNKKTISILFIGNSFSYYHALPKLVALFAEATDKKSIYVDGAFRGGATLKMLWDEENALTKLNTKRWNYMVLQERGRLGGIIKNDVVHVGKPQEFIKYISQFDKIAQKNRTKTILYCPPSFVGINLPKDAQKLDAIYTKAGKRLHAEVIHAGKACILAKKKRSDIALFEKDGHHPNPLGTYLIAALFYRKIFSKKIKNLPLESFRSRSAQLPKNPKTIKIAEKDAKFIWSIANQMK